MSVINHISTEVLTTGLMIPLKTDVCHYLNQVNVNTFHLISTTDYVYTNEDN